MSNLLLVRRLLMMASNSSQTKWSDSYALTSRFSIYRMHLKRILDLIFMMVALLLIWPILLLLYVLLRITIGSPVLFRQPRLGLHNAPFIIYKFRTMTNDRDSNGNFLPDDQRITGIGKIIRLLSLDELPEIFNVLKGDMSFVGPRPLHVHYLERYTPEQVRRHEVIPGITGWAQINGRNNLSWEEKFGLDVWYVDHQSFMLDLRILVITVWKVLSREGISEEGYVAAAEFMGSHRKDSE